MASISLQQRIVDGAKKAGLVAAVGTVVSMVALNGGEPVAVFGHSMPKAVVQGLALGGSTYAATMVLPLVVPWTVGQNPTLQKFEMLVLEPMIAAITIVAVESLVAPGAIGETGGLFGSMIAGAASEVIATYTINGMGWGSA